MFSAEHLDRKKTFYNFQSTKFFRLIDKPGGVSASVGSDMDSAFVLIIVSNLIMASFNNLRPNAPNLICQLLSVY